MWCKYDKSEEQKYESYQRYDLYLPHHNLHRRTRNGTVWVRKRRSPTKLDSTDKSLPLTMTPNINKSIYPQSDHIIAQTEIKNCTLEPVLISKVNTNSSSYILNFNDADHSTDKTGYRPIKSKCRLKT